MQAKSFLDSWQTDTVYGKGKGVEISKHYEFLPVNIDLYWTIREVRPKGAKRRLPAKDVYHRCSYKNYKEVIKKVEAEEWPKTIAMFEIELDSL